MFSNHCNYIHKMINFHSPISGCSPPAIENVVTIFGNFNFVSNLSSFVFSLFLVSLIVFEQWIVWNTSNVTRINWIRESVWSHIVDLICAACAYLVNKTPEIVFLAFKLRAVRIDFSSANSYFRAINLFVVNISDSINGWWIKRTKRVQYWTYCECLIESILSVMCRCHNK